MTKSAALNAFFSSFGINAYPATNVPEDTTFPWLTYENSIGNQGDTISITVQLWYHTESESVPNAKVTNIADAIGLGGKMILCDEGAIWIRRGNPWCIGSNAENDNDTKVRTLNLELEFL